MSNEKWYERLERLAGPVKNKGEDFAERLVVADRGGDLQIDFKNSRGRFTPKKSTETVSLTGGLPNQHYLTGGGRQGGKTELMEAVQNKIIEKSQRHYISIEDLIDNVNAAAFYQWFKIHHRQYKNAPTLISDQETEGGD